LECTRARAGRPQPHNPPAIGIHRTGTAETHANRAASLAGRLDAGLHLHQDRLRRWSIAALLTFLADLTLFNLYEVWVAIPRKLVESDFRIWYSAGLIGSRWGWQHLYDADMMRRAVEMVWPGSRVLPFPNPPPAAWLMVPFTLLPFGPALFLWTLLSLALVVALSQAFAPPSSWARIAFALSAFGFLPVFVMVEAGPLSPPVLLGIAGCVLLLRRGHQVAAGLVLSLILVKPNVAVLVPPALLVAGQVRAFVAWLAPTAVMVVISVLTLGQHGLEGFVAVEMDFAGMGYYLTYSLADMLGGSAAYAIAVPIIVALTLVAARVRRKSDPGLVVAAGVLGSLLINHHLTPADFILLLIPVWVGVAQAQPRHRRVVSAGLWAAGWTTSLGLAWPVAVMELAYIAVLILPDRVRGRQVSQAVAEPSLHL
jgi:hypothetical protein